MELRIGSTLSQKALCVALTAILLIPLALSLMPLSPTAESPIKAHISAAGDTNSWILTTTGTHYASEDIHWSLGHAPQDGENILLDGRATKQLVWDLDTAINDFTVLSNFTVTTAIKLTHGLHITGNFTDNGTASTTSQLTLWTGMIGNFVVDGWSYFGGNSYFWNRYPHPDSSIYFNGPVNCNWLNKGKLDLGIGAVGGQVYFNSTLTVNGSTDPSVDRAGTKDISVVWADATLVHFMGPVIINSTDKVLIGGSHFYSSSSFINISDYLLIGPFNGNYPVYPAIFESQPYFDNITKCIYCGYFPHVIFNFTGELVWSFWDGWFTDFLVVIDVNSPGQLNQSYSIQYGSTTIVSAAGILNIFSGDYRVNGSYNLTLVPGTTDFGVGPGDPAAGNLHNSQLNVYSYFDLTSGNLSADYVNLYGGSFNATSGSLSVNHWDSANGHLDSGHTVFWSNSSNGSIKTDGTQPGGLWDLHILGNLTLLSDVYVNGNYSNSGQIDYNGFRLFNNGSTYASLTLAAMTPQSYTTLNEPYWFNSSVLYSLSPASFNLTTDASWLNLSWFNSTEFNVSGVANATGLFNVTLLANDSSFNDSVSWTITVISLHLDYNSSLNVSYIPDGASVSSPVATFLNVSYGNISWLIFCNTSFNLTVTGYDLSLENGIAISFTINGSAWFNVSITGLLQNWSYEQLVNAYLNQTFDTDQNGSLSFSYGNSSTAKFDLVAQAISAPIGGDDDTGEVALPIYWFAIAAGAIIILLGILTGKVAAVIIGLILLGGGVLFGGGGLI